MQSERGDPASALPLAQRALALLVEADHAANVTRLRAQLAVMQLQLEPPELEAATAGLEQAASEFEALGGSAIDRARTTFYLAKANYFGQFVDHDITFDPASSLVRQKDLGRIRADAVRRSPPWVRAFRRSLEPFVRQRDDPGVSDNAISVVFAAALGETAPRAADDNEAAALGKRLRAAPMPWEITLPRTPLPVPTLVVTGGWSDFFEDIVGALVRAGEVHRVLSGHGHWVPGHPQAAAMLREFAASND